MGSPNLRLVVSADLSGLNDALDDAADTVRAKSAQMQTAMQTASVAAARQYFKDIEERAKQMHQAVQAEIAGLTGGQKLTQGNYSAQETEVRGQEQRREISPGEALGQLQKLHQDELADEASFIQQKIALEAIDPEGNPTKMQQLQNQLALVRMKAHQQEVADTEAALNLQYQQQQKYANLIDQNIFSSLNSWIEGHKSFTRAMQQMWESIAMSAINSMEREVAQKIASTSAMRAAEAAWHEISVMLHLSAAVQKQAITSATNEAQVQSEAAVGAASAAASTAAIPIVGPLMAPAAGAAMMGVIEGFGAMAAFDTGGIMPMTGVALVHQGEGVLTSPVTQMLLNMATKGAPGGGASLTQNNTYQGLTDSTWRAMAQKHASFMVDTMHKELRRRNIA